VQAINLASINGESANVVSTKQLLEAVG